jgi:hypothetical protein
LIDLPRLVSNRQGAKNGKQGEKKSPAFLGTLGVLAVDLSAAIRWTPVT